MSEIKDDPAAGDAHGVGESLTETHLPTILPASTDNDEKRARRRSRLPIPVTSRLVYERATKTRWQVYGAILAIYEVHGAMTDDELYRRYLSEGYPVKSRQCVGTARRELADAQQVRYTGRNGLSDMGNAAKMWERTPNPPASHRATASARAEQRGEFSAWNN